VLYKTSRLLGDEREAAKKHVVDGTAMLAGFTTPILRSAAEIVHSHHERFDGSGYPQGLVGEEIPLVGRIVALADVYDALTAKRVYKNAMSHDVAKSLIVEESGVHFDPDVVEAFLEAEADFINVQRGFADEESADYFANMVTAEVAG
jgi:putative two-component system response regulator